MADLNTKIRGEQIKDGTVTESELNVSVNASLDLADSALQSIPADAIGPDEINAGAETDGYVLTWNTGGTLTWTSKTADVSEDYIQEAELQKVSFAGDDSTVEFDVGEVPVTNSVQVFLNGMLQEDGSGKDYTLATDKVTFSVAPIVGDVVQIYSVKT